MSNGCWEWQGCRNNLLGYGMGSFKGKIMGAHRLSYILFYDKIPNGLVIHHKCENKICVNPYHLEAVTQTENLILAGWGNNNKNSLKTHCPQGHIYTTTTQTKNGKTSIHRICKTCKNKRRNKITEKMSMLEFETKLKIEERLKNSEIFDRTDIVEKGITSFGKGCFQSAMKLKLFEQGVNTYSKNIQHAFKWIERTGIPVEELAKELNLKPKNIRLRIKN